MDAAEVFGWLLALVSLGLAGHAWRLGSRKRRRDAGLFILMAAGGWCAAMTVLLRNF